MEDVFGYLATTDFELVLRMLWHARQINAALQIPDALTEVTYNELRETLIATVRDVHVEANSADGKARFLLTLYYLQL